MRQVLQVMQQTMGVSTPYDAWFQKREKTIGEYPYLLISHQECDMPTLDVVAKGLSEKGIGATAMKNPQLNQFASDSSISNVVVDTDRDVVLWQMDMNVTLNNTGPVHGQSATIPGKMGVVNLFFFSRASDFHRDRVAFDEFLNSFEYDEGFGYEAGLAEKRNRANPAEGLLLFSAVGFFLVIFGSFVAFIIFRLLARWRVIIQSGNERLSE